MVTARRPKRKSKRISHSDTLSGFYKPERTGLRLRVTAHCTSPLHHATHCRRSLQNTGRGRQLSPANLCSAVLPVIPAKLRAVAVPVHIPVILIITAAPGPLGAAWRPSSRASGPIQGVDLPAASTTSLAVAALPGPTALRLPGTWWLAKSTCRHMGYIVGMASGLGQQTSV